MLNYTQKIRFGLIDRKHVFVEFHDNAVSYTYDAIERSFLNEVKKIDILTKFL